MILDFWSIVFFAAVIIILLIYVNFEKDKEEESITSKIKGVNTPHYIMNIMQSEKINLSEYDSDCPITKNMTRIEILQYFEENYNLIKTIYYNPCLECFKNANEDFFTDLNQNTGTNFYFSTKLPRYSMDSRFQYKGLDGSSISSSNKFLFSVPSKNGNIKIEIGYKYEQDD